jgi:hypothetical protein
MAQPVIARATQAVGLSNPAIITPRHNGLHGHAAEKHGQEHYAPSDVEGSALVHTIDSAARNYVKPMSVGHVASTFDHA